MSYDVSLSLPSCGHCGAEARHYGDWNYTYNLSGAWKEAGISLFELNGKQGREVAPILTAGIARMEGDRAKYEKLNPPNSIEFLVRIRDACLRFPHGTLDVG